MIKQSWENEVFGRTNDENENFRTLNDGINDEKKLISFFTKQTMRRRISKKYKFFTYADYFTERFLNEIKFKFCLMFLKNLVEEAGGDSEKRDLEALQNDLIEILSLKEKEKSKLINDLDEIFNDKKVYGRDDVDKEFLDFLEWYPKVKPMAKKKTRRRASNIRMRSRTLKNRIQDRFSNNNNRIKNRFSNNRLKKRTFNNRMQDRFSNNQLSSDSSDFGGSSDDEGKLDQSDSGDEKDSMLINNPYPYEKLFF
jgi:hypothetical protein